MTLCSWGLEHNPHIGGDSMLTSPHESGAWMRLKGKYSKKGASAFALLCINSVAAALYRAASV